MSQQDLLKRKINELKKKKKCGFIYFIPEGEQAFDTT